MNKNFANAAIGGCSLLMAACTSNVDQVQRVQPQGGDEFSRALTREYQELSADQWRWQYDWSDADYFARKGLVTARGEPLPPESPEKGWRTFVVTDDLIAERTRLVNALQAGAASKAPDLAARAQSRYDCWVGNAADPYLAEEGAWFREKVLVCRDEFKTAMNDLEAQMRPAAAGAPAMPPREQSYLVFFEFDRAELTPEATRVVQRALSTYRAGGAPRIVVTGHADRAGPPSHNDALSKRRAAQVRDALVKAGVPANQIVTQARGENAPLLPTPDGVAEPQNRRVEIEL